MSPCVAAFFAFEEHLVGATPSDQVAAWSPRRDSTAWAGNGVDVLSPSARGNDRMGRQAGAFTLCRTAVGSLEEHVRRTGGTALTRFLIPATAAPAALADLDALGITAHDLFPDLGGLAGQALTRALLGRG